MRMSRLHVCGLVPGAVAALLITGCVSPLASPPAAAQWQEGDTVYYDDGCGYRDAVSVKPPHHQVCQGSHHASEQPSAVHYHRSLSPDGPPNTWILCFATRDDGRWRHRPQWRHELNHAMVDDSD